MTLDPLEVTDYLRAHFPPYALTEDTAVKPFKHYFRKEGEGWIRIVNPSATANPKTSGWYEATRLHHKEYQHHVDSIKVNNIGVLSQFLCAWLAGDDRVHPGFPKETLPRQLGGMDWTLNFHDTRFKDVVGSTPVPRFAVTFNNNMQIVTGTRALVISIAQNIGKLYDQWAWSELEGKFDPQTLIDETVTQIKPTYEDYGYYFFPEDLGSAGRVDDMYTLAALWARTDWRQSFMMIQEAYKTLLALHGNGMVSDEKVADWKRYLDMFDRAARTVAHIAKLVGSTVIVDAASFEEKLVTDVPPTIVVDGITMYRLAFQRQIVNGAKYGKLVSDWAGNVELVDINQEFSPSIKFAWLNLPESGAAPGNLTTPYHYVQNGNIWYTTVPYTS